jgi:NADH:ubiquinone oxidoreductase subunit F (NADH-binding)/NADH:ubiquinone oxidoreductase subunit E
MIVQELNRIQHQFGFLPEGELRRLAERIGEPLHRLHEVASYYPHYRLRPPPAVQVHVCRDMACHLHGADRCRRELETLAGEIGGGVMKVEEASCLGRCDAPPAVSINDEVYWGKTAKELESLVRLAAAGEELPRQRGDRAAAGWNIDPYRGEPRYDAVRRLVEAWKADPDRDRAMARRRLGDPVLKNLETATLRGMGGAGFATVRKWSTVRDAPGDIKYVVCNADESEPGTFKDRELLRRAPYLAIEGMIVDALVIGAERGWIFVRHEYRDEIDAIREALAEAQRQRVCGRNILGTEMSFEMELFVSPGGYICGEETALLEALEDRRAEPRNKPPLMSHEGLFGKPTSMNNVETFSWVPSILIHGGEWYRDLGRNGAKGMRFVSVSGDVVRPGVYEIPWGLKVRELVYDIAGGLPEGRSLKAVATSGPSGGFLPPVLKASAEPRHFVEGLIKRGVITPDAAEIDLLNVPMEKDVFMPFPDFMLGAAFLVYGDERNMLEQALNGVEFYRNESCGKCVPCRMGTQKLVEMLQGHRQGEPVDWSLVDELADAMLISSICGLGQVAANPIKTVIKYFPQDIEQFAAEAAANG